MSRPMGLLKVPVHHEIFLSNVRVIQSPYIPSILADLFVQLSLAEFHLLLESRSLSLVLDSQFLVLRLLERL